MAESWKTRLNRWGFNFWPCFRGTGGRITYISADYREIRLKIPLSWRTRNYIGTIYGGSIYGAVDPIYMLILIKCLGPEYMAVDKGASIQFKRPGKTTLYATCKVDEAELDEIRTRLEDEKSIDREYEIEIVDEEGQVCAVVDKVVYVAKKKGRDQ